MVAIAKHCFVPGQENKAMRKELLCLKSLVLRIQICCREMEETVATTETYIICHMMTHNFGQDAFLNKHHVRKMFLARCLLHRKEHRQNKQRDNMRFPELVTYKL